MYSTAVSAPSVEHNRVISSFWIWRSRDKIPAIRSRRIRFLLDAGIYPFPPSWSWLARIVSSSWFKRFFGQLNRYCCMLTVWWCVRSIGMFSLGFSDASITGRRPYYFVLEHMRLSAHSFENITANHGCGTLVHWHIFLRILRQKRTPFSRLFWQL